MKLTNNHRSGFLMDLEKSNEQIKTLEDRIEHLQENPGKDPEQDKKLLSWWEIDLFLEKERKKLIEQSLINNEIDF